ncbi:hypothetical protein [Roseitalea porphyridii]|uniref:HEAT repeat domain-containing protein n=1 Tax=Roseitalea porphyridii TaxID=1852022 RepID=A0A4P6UZZ2_9HYPH|nr:hypothetical protein [Roseitalea porphyridii]QBK30385.1 hypothetical protein E0E05_07095 [Roseitalea porphyridii]
MEPFRMMLAGGHPNSLGRTLEVVEIVLDDPGRMDELFDCYFSEDAIVRLRTSNACRRVFKARPDWFPAWADRFITEVSAIDQPSAKWTLAQLFLEHEKRLTAKQRAAATAIMIRNLQEEDDWIALNMTMKTLQRWVKRDAAIIPRIEVRVRALADDRRKSVANGARKLLNAMDVPAL